MSSEPISDCWLVRVAVTNYLCLPDHGQDEITGSLMCTDDGAIGDSHVDGGLPITAGADDCLFDPQSR